MLIELYKKFGLEQEKRECLNCVHKEHSYSMVPHSQICICRKSSIEDQSQAAQPESKLF